MFDQENLALWEHLDLYIELAGHEKPWPYHLKLPTRHWRSLADVTADVKDRVGEKTRAELKKQGLDLDKLTGAAGRTSHA